MIIKRCFDIIFALVTSIVAVPITLISMLVIKIASPESPVIFKQKRIGYKRRPFIMLKLRSMTNERGENGELLPDEERLKLWGKIIRKLPESELLQALEAEIKAFQTQ